MTSGTDPDPSGFSEAAMRALEDYERSLPPRDATIEPPRADGRPAPDHRPHYWGHRERLRQRFKKGADSLPEYEILELILFNAVPRIDVKPLTKALLARFGSLNEVLASPAHALEVVPGVNQKVPFHFRLFEHVAGRLTRNKIRERPVIVSAEELTAYCNAVLANRDAEEFWCLFLDRKNVLIADEMLGRGTVDHVPVFPVRS